MQVAEEHYSSDYRCTISIDSLQEGQQEKEGMYRNFVNFNFMLSNRNKHYLPIFSIKLLFFA